MSYKAPGLYVREHHFLIGAENMPYCAFCDFKINLPIGSDHGDIFSHIRASDHCPADERVRETLRNKMSAKRSSA